MISTAFPRVEEGGEGVEVGTLWAHFIHAHINQNNTRKCSEKTSVADPDPYLRFKDSGKFRVLYKVMLLGCPCPDILILNDEYRPGRLCLHMKNLACLSLCTVRYSKAQGCGFASL
jgi:hypothetical protein